MDCWCPILSCRLTSPSGTSSGGVMSIQKRATRPVFRPLLPMTGSVTSSSVNDKQDGHAFLSGQSVTTLGRRKHVVAACEACRARKSKCSATRPRCTVCITRNTDCVYNTNMTETHSQALKRKYSDLLRQPDLTASERLIELLKTRSEYESRILRCLRDGTSPEAVLKQLEDGDLLIQLHLVPLAHRQYQFPICSNMPAYILTSNNPYLQSIIFEQFPNTPSNITGDSPSKASFVSSLSSPQRELPFFVPCHAAEIVDPLISKVTVSQWTLVISDNQLLRKLLMSYFLYQFPSFGTFHKDHFLADMAAGRKRFCSSLLVNAILAAACHSYDLFHDRSKFWDPSSLTYKFTAEAKRLWDLEGDQKGKLTTIQAAVILHVISNLDGLDNIGQLYLLPAIVMAHDMKLFDQSLHIKSKTLKRVRQVTAWGIFNWQSPLILENPPQPPMPDPVEDPDWYGEIWLRYPQSTTLYPIHLAHITRARGEVRTILNDMASQFFKEPKKDLSLEEVYEVKARLDHWLTSLPMELSTRFMVYPHHFPPHFEHCAALIALFQPMAAMAETDSNKATTNYEITPQDVIIQTKVRFETLLRLYYTRHSFKAYDPFLTNFLFLLANQILESLKHLNQLNGAGGNKEDERAYQSTIVLCASGLHYQKQSYHLANLIFHALKGLVGEQEQNLIEMHASDDDIDERSVALTQHSLWPVPIVKITRNDDPHNATLDKLLNTYHRVHEQLSSTSSQIGNISDSE